MRFKPRSIYDVLALASFFLVVAGGTALASYVISSNSQVGPNTISGHHVSGGAHPNLIAGSVGSRDVADNTLSGADVNESKLGQVPSALLGGYGRWAGGGSCNPPSGLVNPGPFVNCASVSVNLPAPARVLLMGQATGVPEDGQGKLGLGNCRLGSTEGPFSDSTTSVNTTTEETVSPVAVSGALTAGQHSFGIDCNDAGAPVVGGGQIRYKEAGIVAVAISPN